MFVEAQLGCHLFREYINTHANHLADDLSRDNLLSKVPSANPNPTSDLLSLLLNTKVDWVSPHWRQQFSNIFNRMCHVE